MIGAWAETWLSESLAQASPQVRSDCNFSDSSDINSGCQSSVGSTFFLSDSQLVVEHNHKWSGTPLPLSGRSRQRSLSGVTPSPIQKRFGKQHHNDSVSSSWKGG